MAKELLADTGSIFVQISDENLHRVRCVMDEVFGNDNFVAQITFRTTSSLGVLAGNFSARVRITSFGLHALNPWRSTRLCTASGVFKTTSAGDSQERFCRMAQDTCSAGRSATIRPGYRRVLESTGTTI
jgi:hypothetical protein